MHGLFTWIKQLQNSHKYELHKYVKFAIFFTIHFQIVVDRCWNLTVNWEIFCSFLSSSTLGRCFKNERSRSGRLRYLEILGIFNLAEMVVTWDLRPLGAPVSLCEAELVLLDHNSHSETVNTVASHIFRILRISLARQNTVVFPEERRGED